MGYRGIYLYHLDSVDLLQSGSNSLRHFVVAVSERDISLLRILAIFDPLLQTTRVQDSGFGAFPSP